MAELSPQVETASATAPRAGSFGVCPREGDAPEDSLFEGVSSDSPGSACALYGSHDAACEGIDDILLCGDDCVRCGACFGEAGDACAFEGVAAAGERPRVDERAYGRIATGSLLDGESLEAEVAEVLERRGFPSYAARSAAEAAVEAAFEIWQPCRCDGAL